MSFNDYSFRFKIISVDKCLSQANFIPEMKSCKALSVRILSIIFLFVSIKGASSFANGISVSKYLENCKKNELIQSNISHILRVSSTHYEPFMYLNEKGQFDNGIEYKLLKTIAEKLHLDLVIQNQISLQNDDHLNSK